MPTNKNASYRYRLLDTCLRNRQRKWTIADLQAYISQRLIEELDVTRLNKDGMAVSIRQLNYDIAIMKKDPPEGFAAPIVCVDGYYSYDDPNYILQGLKFLHHEISAIREALLVLRQFPSLPHYESLQEIYTGMTSNQFLNTDRDIIQFESNPLLKGIHWLKPLYLAVKHQQPILLSYLPYNRPNPLVSIVHPYLLKEYNNRWFLLAFSESEQMLWTYSLDRIEAFSPVDTPFKPNDVFDPHVYFQHIIGVTIPADLLPEHVLIKFSPGRAPYILTKPLHHSQHVISNDESGILIQLYIIPNWELRTLLLSFGEDAEVVSPVNLREAISGALKQALSKY